MRARPLQNRVPALPSARATMSGSTARLDGLLDLDLVRLPASVSLGVLLLPLLTLLLVTADPFVGLWVEALGVLVVAGLVVLGSHAVHRRVELSDRAAGVVGRSEEHTSELQSLR